MNYRKNPITRLLTLFLLVPGAMSCISHEALQQELDDRNVEIMDLRDERDLLGDQLRSERGEKSGLESALAEARLQLVQRPQPVEAASPRAGADGLAGMQGLGVPVSMRDGRVVITLPSAITFASGKAVIMNSAKSTLKKVASRLQSEYGTNAIFHIEGHTDSDPINKSEFGSNRELSLARSLAVLYFIVEECRIPDDQFVVVGHGQYQAIASNDTKANKARNRRVEIVIHRK